ncbi:thermonuclease, partial [Enterococcus faecalis]
MGKKWLLVAVATLLLSGCASLEQKAQDFVQVLSQDVNEGFFKTISTNQRIPAEFVRHVDADTTV